MKRREEMTWLERLYFWEVFKGVIITFGNFLKNLTVYLCQCIGLCKGKQPWVTVEYPDQVSQYSPRYRGRHRLTLKSDGSVKCTACYLCATACPAQCIHIEPGEHEDPLVEKFPERYEIDTLLCVYCGYCVEACPVDAIRMDTGIHPEVYTSDPKAFIEDKEILMQRSVVLEEQGPTKVLSCHLERMRKIEKFPLRSEATKKNL